MASNKGLSIEFKILMIFIVSLAAMLFYACIREQKQLKDVTTKVVAKKVVSNRVVRDNIVSNENGPVTVELNLKDISFDLKNSN